jgi:hypothetical protein
MTSKSAVKEAVQQAALYPLAKTVAHKGRMTRFLLSANFRNTLSLVSTSVYDEFILTNRDRYVFGDCEDNSDLNAKAESAYLSVETVSTDRCSRSETNEMHTSPGTLLRGNALGIRILVEFAREDHWRGQSSYQWLRTEYCATAEEIGDDLLKNIIHFPAEIESLKSLLLSESLSQAEAKSRLCGLGALWLGALAIGCFDDLESRKVFLKVAENKNEPDRPLIPSVNVTIDEHGLSGLRVTYQRPRGPICVSDGYTRPSSTLGSGLTI